MDLIPHSPNESVNIPKSDEPKVYIITHFGRIRAISDHTDITNMSYDVIRAEFKKQFNK